MAIAIDKEVAVSLALGPLIVFAKRCRAAHVAVNGKGVAIDRFYTKTRRLDELIGAPSDQLDVTQKNLAGQNGGGDNNEAEVVARDDVNE
jgi:hypothetical protein